MKDAIRILYNTFLSMFAGIGVLSSAGLVYWLMKTKFFVGG